MGTAGVVPGVIAVFTGGACVVVARLFNIGDSFPAAVAGAALLRVPRGALSLLGAAGTALASATRGW